MPSMSPEDLEELHVRVEEFLKLHRNQVTDWRSFPFDAIVFGEYTAEQLKEEWTNVLKSAMKCRTIELDMERVSYFFKMNTFLRHNGDKGKKPKAAPKKRRATAYSLFLSDFFKQNPEIRNRQKFELCSQAWKACDDATRKKYLEMAVAKNTFLDEEPLSIASAVVAANSLSSSSLIMPSTMDDSAKKKKAKSKMKNGDVDLEVAFKAFCEAKSDKYALKYGQKNLTQKLQKKFMELEMEKKKDWYEYGLGKQQSS